MVIKHIQCVIVLACIFSCTKHIQRDSGEALGTSYHIIYGFQKKIETSDIFEKTNQSMSTYRDSSLISKINRGERDLKIDSLFEKVFETSKNIWRKTDGFFDPTVGPLLKLWGFGASFSQNNAPNIKHIDSIKKKIGFEKVLIKNGKIFAPQGVELDFNALAKGYCVDLIGKRLENSGVENYLIEVGGEILTKGHNPDIGKAWVVGIEDPTSTVSDRKIVAKVELQDKALATSGSYRKFKTDSITGERFSHIINPKTGMPKKNNIISVSVLANSCMEADAYATAFMLMSPKKIMSIVETIPDIEVYLCFYELNNLECRFSKDFEVLIK